MVCTSLGLIVPTLVSDSCNMDELMNPAVLNGCIRFEDEAFKYQKITIPTTVYVVKNTRSYLLSEHPYYTQLISCYHSRRIPQSFSDRGNTDLLLFEHDKHWNEVETSKCCFKWVIHFLVPHAFCNFPYCKIESIPQPDSPCHLGVLCLQIPPSPCLFILRCVSVLKQDTREKIFSQGH